MSKSDEVMAMSKEIGKKFCANTGAGIFIGTVAAIYVRNDETTLIYPDLVIDEVPALQAFDAETVTFLG